MSVVTFGTSFVGKVERVPGKSYVVTKVFQIVNMPLVPLAGYVVAEGTETQSFVSGLSSFEGTEIALSWKSFGWGVARALMFGAGLLALIGVLPLLLGLATKWAMLLLGPVLGAVLLATWWRTRRGLLARGQRALELAHAHGRLPRAIVHRAS
jgi:uncharacterized membrane protein YphA (DoxX/SURF4 family)